MDRKDFPILEKTAFLDSGAGLLKPLPVIEKIVEYYRDYPINLHSIDSALGAKLYGEYLEARKTVADLVDATPEEVIFTSGTTDSINRTARMFEAFVKKGDRIVLSKYNHSSNAVPWIKLGERTGAEVVFSDDLFSDITENTKVVAYAQENNTIHQDIDIAALANAVEAVGAVLVNDAAQAINSRKVSLDYSDVIAFSGTKLYGPTGIGALVIKKELLDMLEPATWGGGAVVRWNEEGSVDKTSIDKFEGGTLNVAGLLGMAEGIKYMLKHDDLEYKKNLQKFAHEKLKDIEGIEFFSKPGDIHVMFRLKGVASQDLVSYLGHRGVIMRSGKHCALYLFNSMGVVDTVRMSFGSYNNEADILKAVELIKNGGDFIEGL